MSIVEDLDRLCATMNSGRFPDLRESQRARWGVSALWSLAGLRDRPRAHRPGSVPSEPCTSHDEVSELLWHAVDAIDTESASDPETRRLLRALADYTAKALRGLVWP